MYDKLTSEDMITDADNYNAALEMIEAQLELEMIEADRYAEIDEYIDEMYDELELEDDDDADEDDEYDEDMYSEMDALAHADTSCEDWDETQSLYDDDRDGDFYSS